MLKKDSFPEGNKHRKIYRPWGCYESIAEELRWQVKLINVKPGEELSLQMHHHRSEHWVVVKGTAKVEIDAEVSVLSENIYKAVDDLVEKLDRGLRRRSRLRRVKRKQVSLHDLPQAA